MKRCPHCDRVETDEALKFCRVDGATLALLGHIHARLDQRSEAEAVIRELEKRYENHAADGRDLAIVYSAFDKDQAFAWLEKGFAGRSPFLVFLRLEPLMEPLKSDPRWHALERRVGIIQ